MNSDGTKFTNHEATAFKEMKSRGVKPINIQLVQEKVLRLIAAGEKIPMVNRQTKRPQLVQWLQENPRNDDTVDYFITTKIKSLHKKAEQAMKAKASRANNGGPSLRCSEPKPYLQIMHCIVRYEETAQLDGRNNPETARPHVWVKISELYNDMTFIISTNRYP